MMAALLSPAESLFLLKPNRTPARETVKVTLLSLLAQGLVRLEEQVTKRFIGTRKTVYVRPTRRPVPALPAHTASLLDQVRAAQAYTGSMSDVVTRARQAYGSGLNRFNRDFIIPRLLTRGLIEGRSVLFLRRYKRTPAGDAEESRIAADIARARSIPELLRSDAPLLPPDLRGDAHSRRRRRLFGFERRRRLAPVLEFIGSRHRPFRRGRTGSRCREPRQPRSQHVRRRRIRRARCRNGVLRRRFRCLGGRRRRR
jgi:hypothetical protein